MTGNFETACYKYGIAHEGEKSRAKKDYEMPSKIFFGRKHSLIKVDAANY